MAAPRAQAPTPGTTPTAQAAKAQARSRGLQVTVGEEVATLYLADIGPRDDIAFRHATTRVLGHGLSLSAIVERITNGAEEVGLDTLCLIHWHARVRAGAQVTLDQALDAFPTYDQYRQRQVVVDVEIVEDLEDGSPEA